MLVLLPISFLCLMMLAERARGASFVRALLVGFVSFCAAAVVVAEVLSAFDAFRPGPLQLAWAALSLASLLWALRLVRGTTAGRLRPVLTDRLWVVVALSPVAVFVTAVIAPPNTWDAMTYHLPRAMHSLQNGNLSLWPTHVERQVLFAPLHEILSATLIGTGGSDGAVNLIQWLALCVCAAGAAELATAMGATAERRLLAAAFVLSAPECILQGSSAQNDLLTAAGAISALVFATDLARDHGSKWRAASLLGLSLGLAVLTKSTAVLFLPAPLAVLLWNARARWRTVAAPLVAALALALAVNAPHWIRTARALGTPVPSPASVHNQSPGPRALTSNVLRNLASELATPTDRVNGLIERSVIALHRVMGADPSDPAATFPNEHFALSHKVNHEDVGSNPLHVVLAAVALCLSIARRHRPVWSYGAAVVFGGLLFCLLLRWQPWATRLHVPLIVLISPVIALELGWSQRSISVLTAALIVLAVPWLVFNASRPWFGSQSIFTTPREAQYFANNHALALRFASLEQALNGTTCEHLGLIEGPDSWEYPLWLIAEPGGPRTVHHVDVGNSTASLRESGNKPCAVIVFDVKRAPDAANGPFQSVAIDETATLFVSGSP